MNTNLDTRILELEKTLERNNLRGYALIVDFESLEKTFTTGAKFSTGDVASNSLVVQLLNNKEVIVLDKNDAVYILVKKPTGDIVYLPCDILNGEQGIIVTKLDVNSVSESGLYEFDITITNGKDYKMVSPRMSYNTYENIGKVLEDPSGEKVTILDTLISEVNTAKKFNQEKYDLVLALSTENANLEIIDARNGSKNLGTRLTNIETHLEDKAKKGKNIRIIAKENGDYTLPSQCVADGGDTIENPITMIVYPGTYEDQVYIKQWSRINMVGTNKKDCIIVNHGGSYTDEPLITAGERYIANITFRATHEKSTVTDKNQWKSYAFHGDKSSGGDGTTLIENCRFESYHNASVGLGIYNNQTFHFKNCEFYSKIDWDSSQANVGAFFAHNAVAGGVTNGKLILENCTFFMDNDRSGYGHACYINDANLTDGDGSGNALNVTFINCTLMRNVGGFVNALRVDNSNSISKLSGSIDLNICSHGNNISQLNAPQMIWQYPTLPSGVSNFNGSFSQCRYGKDKNGNVFIEGLIKGCTDSMDLFTLPIGYRPKYNKYYNIVSNDGSNLKTGTMIINSNGVVRLDKNIGSAFISLECSFVAEQ